MTSRSGSFVPIFETSLRCMIATGNGSILDSESLQLQASFSSLKSLSEATSSSEARLSACS